MKQSNILDKSLVFKVILHLSALGEKWTPAAYALFRVAFSVIILTHGIPKLLGIPHGNIQEPMPALINGIQNVFQLPFAPQLAFIVMIVETLGAVCISLGLMTRFVSGVFAIQMVFACYLHAPKFAWAIGGYEYPLMLVFISLYMSVHGSGQYSLDQLLIKRHKAGVK